MTRSPSKGRGYPTPSMARVEKPYRVYKGGRVKGKVPLERPQRQTRRDGRGPDRPRVHRPRRRWSWKRRIAVGLLVLILLAVTSIAIIMFFRADPRGEDAWHRLIAPALSAVLLTGIVVLAVLHYNILLGVPLSA